ncbi:MAG: hypothetical protein Q8R91_08540 [Candidatus Omnitrophota bacterium]|nr:hypothetical protein [Candidatus Omnitrophota bacterium]
MLRQLNVKRQLTIPAPLAKRLGFSSKGWVEVAEQHGILVVVPVRLKMERAKSSALSDDEWQAFNRHVREELRAGKGTVYPDAQAFLSDLKRRTKG